MTIDRDRALSRLREHRHYRYRACAPHWDDPSVCAADETVPVGVFLSAEEEEQGARLKREASARRLCSGCPIVAPCLEYAVGDGEVVRERHHVWGGTTGHERRELLHLRRAVAGPVWSEPLPVEQLRTGQRQAVLAALAAHEDLGEVAAASGLPEQIVAWQVSRLGTLLRLPDDRRGREDIVAAARAAGVLPEPVRVLAAAAVPSLDELVPGAPVLHLVTPNRPPAAVPARAARLLEAV